MDLSTTYLGLKLANPLMPGASSLTDDPTTIRRLVDHGAAAIVLHSIYEEQITRERSNRFWYDPIYPIDAEQARSRLPRQEEFSHSPAQYLEHIADLKRTIPVPLIASINCANKGRWIEYAGAIEESGADALELNPYFLPTHADQSADDVESRLVDIVAAVCERLKIPVAVKLSPFYTSLPNLARQLENAGAAGIVLFNRFYQPDFEVSTRAAVTGLKSSDASDPSELRLRLKWLAILSPQTRMSLALTGGVYTGLDAVKGIIAGAHAVQVVSSLLTAGPQYMETILQGLTDHMKRAGADSIRQLRGCMNHNRAEDPAIPERSGYLSLLHSRPTHHPT
jgi:dihydroorotate dehydrogenase (fumarate)